MVIVTIKNSFGELNSINTVYTWSTGYSSTSFEHHVTAVFVKPFSTLS